MNNPYAQFKSQLIKIDPISYSELISNLDKLVDLYGIKNSDSCIYDGLTTNENFLQLFDIVILRYIRAQKVKADQIASDYSYRAKKNMESAYSDKWYGHEESAQIADNLSQKASETEQLIEVLKENYKQLISEIKTNKDEGSQINAIEIGDRNIDFLMNLVGEEERTFKS